jgi:hypothetical protein
MMLLIRVIDDLVFDSSGIWFHLTYDLTLNVYDNVPVPMPGAVWLLGSGIVGLAVLKLRQKS